MNYIKSKKTTQYDEEHEECIIQKEIRLSCHSSKYNSIHINFITLQLKAFST